MSYYPRDVTKFVQDLAETPGVQRVLIREIDEENLVPVAVWPSKFKPDSPIILQQGQFLRIEGEWMLGNTPFSHDISEFFNSLRESEGQPPDAITSRGHFVYRPHWPAMR